MIPRVSSSRRTIRPSGIVAIVIAAGWPTLPDRNATRSSPTRVAGGVACSAESRNGLSCPSGVAIEQPPASENLVGNEQAAVG